MIFVKILSRLPWPIMLGLSSFMYWTAYKIFGYRRKVVDRNLKHSFPDKSDKEIRDIRRQYYRSFFDFIMETLKAITISDKEIRKRIRFVNPELIESTPKGKAIVLLGTHIFSWEWSGMAFSEYFERQFIFSYQKLSSNFSENLMKNTRSKFGGKGVLRHETAKSIIGGRTGHNAFYVIADQAPVGKAQRYWTRFLNQETSFYHGIGKVAKLGDTPVLVMLSEKRGRGLYDIRFEWVAQDLEKVTGEDILDKYISILERQINTRPSEWLWTHKRWKNKVREGDIFSKSITAHVEE